ncbi:hypothetical protein PS2_015255 [Malus domestica]
MELVRTVILPPTDAASGLEVLVDEVAALLEVVDAFDAVAPPEFLPDDLGLLDVDQLLPHQVLPYLQHRHRVLVRIRWIEVVRWQLVEVHHSLLPPHFSHVVLDCSLSLHFGFDFRSFAAFAVCSCFGLFAIWVKVFQDFFC